MARSLLVLLVAVAGCAGPPAAPPTPPVPPPGRTLDLPPLRIDRLEALFGPRQVAAAVAYDRAFRDVRTAADLRAVYDRALALERTLLSPTYDVEWRSLDRFRAADLGLPGLDPTCVGECTVPAFTLDLADWRRAAAHVGGPGAAAFFDAVGQVYRATWVTDGRLGGWPAYIEQTWDYGGHSRLGSGIHADLLARLHGAVGDRYRIELATFFADVAQDALTTACVGPTAAEARAELVRIRDAYILNRRQDEVEARVAAFARPAAFGIEAGCARSGCACEGG